MKAHKRSFLLIIALGAGLLAMSARATEAEIDNRYIEGMSGVINVSAALVNSPCHLSADTAEQEIEMGAVPEYRLRNPGHRAEPVNLHLTLEGCQFDTFARSPERAGGLTVVPGQPVVMFTAIGVADAHNPHLFSLQGRAKGVGLALTDSEHRAIIPGERSRPQILLPGRSTLTLHAHLTRTEEALVPGDYRAVVNIGLEYP